MATFRPPCSQSSCQRSQYPEPHDNGGFWIVIWALAVIMLVAVVSGAFS